LWLQKSGDRESEVFKGNREWEEIGNRKCSKVSKNGINQAKRESISASVFRDEWCWKWKHEKKSSFHIPVPRS